MVLRRYKQRGMSNAHLIHVRQDRRCRLAHNWEYREPKKGCRRMRVTELHLVCRVFVFCFFLFEVITSMILILSCWIPPKINKFVLERHFFRRLSRELSSSKTSPLPRLTVFPSCGLSGVPQQPQHTPAARTPKHIPRPGDDAFSTGITVEGVVQHARIYQYDVA